MNGYGIYKYTNGQIYEGEYINGIREGKGRIILNNKIVYEGDFLGGHRVVKGRITSSNRLTNNEKLGQMIFPRFNYKNRTDDIKNKKPGGFVLFAYDFDYNATFIQDYIKEIQNLSDSNVGLPLGLAVDEEGGTVVRVSKYHRYEKFPSPQQIYNESGNDGIAKIAKKKKYYYHKVNTVTIKI